MPSFAVLYNPAIKAWQRYAEPVEEIAVTRLENVLSALDHIETRVEREGLHAAGYLSYEAAPAFDDALQTHAPTEFPLLRFGLFAAPDMIDLPEPSQPLELIDWQPAETMAAFTRKVDGIRAAIARGETYQVNLTFPLYGECREEPWQFFLNLVKGQPPAHCGFLQDDDWAICSASPELFFARNGKHLQMKPMKGTAPRGRTSAEDQQQARQLQQSAKNRAENVMILDMVRNDLGRIAPPGGVTTEAICSLEKYPTVWQMTSTATASSNASLVDIFKALFPCASITGAPKARTMQIIRAAEAQPRNIYTGTFGWIAPDRKAHFNVAIRTAVLNRLDHKAVYGIGAGITWDSIGHDEYRECLDKAAVLTEPRDDFALIETLRWTPGKGYFILAEHLKRLQASAEYFDFSFDPSATETFLANYAADFPAAPQRVRLLLHRDGNMEAATQTLEEPGRLPIKITLAAEPVDSSGKLLYHKTTRRDLYEHALAGVPAAEEVVLWNEHGEVTECCTANLVVELDGELVTPPVTSGLLPGTYRDYLLSKGVLKERVISKSDLLAASRIYLVNAVRKWRRALFVGTVNGR